jgi:choline-sulfatase
MMKTKQKSILLIMVDEQPVFFLEAYGHPFVQTPAVSKLANQGMLFDSAYCCSPICAPCRSSMMTSRYIHDIEVWDNASPLRGDWPTFAHDFRAAGYKTILCGKMHFVGPDQMHGFTERWVPDIYPATFDWSRSNRHEVARNNGGQNRTCVEQAGPGYSEDMDYDKLVLKKTVEKLPQLLKESDENPFLLIVSFTGPHFPFKAPEEFWKLYNDEEIELPRAPEENSSPEHEYIKWVKRMGSFEKPVSDEACRAARQAILARTTMVDSYMETILDMANDSRAIDNLYIAYTSDHGDMMGEHGLWYKNVAYEWSSRVPLIIKGPDIQIRRSKETVSLIDIGPTLADLAQIPLLEIPRAGRSFANLLRGERGDEEGRAIIENYGEGIKRGVRTIVKGRYKLNASFGTIPELFDLEADPDEWHNRAEDSEYQDIRKKLEDELYSDWGNPEEHDEKCWQSEERRLAILTSLKNGPALDWLPSWKKMMELNSFTG